MKAILIVLDGLGIGAMNDALEYGDSLEVNTLLNVISFGTIDDFPILKKLGLFSLLDGNPQNNCSAITMKLNELSKGKDTITGHWEMMGIVTKKAHPVLEFGFTSELIAFIENIVGSPIIGLKNISGTKILDEYGAIHYQTGYPIVYTSSDSVIQIAASEDIVPIEVLYHWCQNIHSNLPEAYKVARVIARPFIIKEDSFIRTHNRKDFSIQIPYPNTLSRLLDNKVPIYTFGKISDIYQGIKFTNSERIDNNSDGMKKLIANYQSIKKGLFVINLNDFDSKYGHRRDLEGYYNALKRFDKELGDLITVLDNTDFLLLTSDHGCDPLGIGTNHTREKVPFILHSKQLSHKYGYKGERNAFTIVGETLEKLFNKAINRLKF